MHIRLKIENPSSVAVIYHMGTNHSAQLNTMNNEIWEWCIARNLWISAGHIAGKSNVEADQASRQNLTATECVSKFILVVDCIICIVSSDCINSVSMNSVM